MSSEAEGETLLRALGKGPPESIDDALVTCAALYASDQSDLAWRVFAALRSYVPRPDSLQGWPRKRLELLIELDWMRAHLHAHPTLWAELARSMLAEDNKRLDEYGATRFRKNDFPSATLFANAPHLHDAYQGALTVPREKARIENYVRLGILIAVAIVVKVAWRLYRHTH